MQSFTPHISLREELVAPHNAAGHTSSPVHIFILTMHTADGENKFTPDFMNGFLAALKYVEEQITSHPNQPSALITTGEAKSRFYSNGIDLKWSAAHPDQVESLSRLLLEAAAKILTFPIPTFAAINGHCYAGALMLALAHDYRLMREDKGWLCLPALDLGLQLPQGLHEIMKAKLSQTLWREVALECRRFGGLDAFEKGLVDWAGPCEKVLPVTIQWAAKIAAKGAGTNRAACQSLKMSLYGRAHRLLLSGKAIEGLAQGEMKLVLQKKQEQKKSRL